MHTNHQAPAAFAALDRRAFVAGAAAVAAGTAALASAAHADEAAPVADDRNGTSARAAQETADETVECDVVIAGAGIAGLMAADHLAEQGFKVCLLEKGVSAVVSDWAQCGGPNACETKLQEQEGEWVSLDDMFKYMYGFSNGSVNAKLLKNVLAGTGPSIDRMCELGIPMHLWEDAYGVGFRGRHFIDASPSDRTDPIVADIEANGGTVTFGAAVYAILMEDGKAVGVQAEVDGKVVDYRAKATVIATGGFLGNTQMQQEHFNTPIFPLGNTVSDGTGIQMVLDAGGALVVIVVKDDELPVRGELHVKLAAKAGAAGFLKGRAGVFGRQRAVVLKEAAVGKIAAVKGAAPVLGPAGGEYQKEIERAEQRQYAEDDVNSRHCRASPATRRAASSRSVWLLASQMSPLSTRRTASSSGSR